MTTTNDPRLIFSPTRIVDAVASRRREQVETALAAHPDVIEVAVVAFPDERWGEVPLAWIVAREGSGLDEKVLAGFVEARLARFKLPRRSCSWTRSPTGAPARS